MLRRLTACWLVVAVLANSSLAAIASETAFPFGREVGASPLVIIVVWQNVRNSTVHIDSPATLSAIG